jgi:hypothetical protein
LIAVLYSPSYGSALHDTGNGPATENFNIDEIKKQINGNGNPETSLDWENPEQYAIFSEYDGAEDFVCVPTKPDDGVWVYLYPDDDTQAKRVIERRNKRNQEKHSDALLMYTSRLYEYGIQGETVCSFVQESTGDVTEDYKVHGFLLEVIPYIASKNIFNKNEKCSVQLQVGHLSTGDDFVRYIYTGILQIDADDVDEYRLRVESMTQLANFLCYEPLEDAIYELPDWAETCLYYAGEDARFDDTS